jgi:hypothetical protein
MILSLLISLWFSVAVTLALNDFFSNADGSDLPARMFDWNNNRVFMLVSLVLLVLAIIFGLLAEYYK